ncbi:MAG: hypothetical protein J6K16_02250 [Alphaproteobacteria bacterium]|nr:hypothetical protein [Alphaproteobacteria bacterium]
MDFKIKYSEEQLADMMNNKSINIELVNRDFAGYQALTEGDKKALQHLTDAAKMMNNVALEQDNPYNLSAKKYLEENAVNSSHIAKALELFNSINGVAGFNGVDEQPIELFENITLLKGRNFYPQDLEIEEFHDILLKMIKEGKIKEVQNILSARTMVRRDGKELKGIDYTEYFADEFSYIANELEVAAYYTSNNEFKEYLGWQAQAFLQNNEDMDMLADKHWAVMQDTPLEFTISRENYDDEITPTIYDNKELAELINIHKIEAVSKDMLGVRVGIVNKDGTDLILKFKHHLPDLARLMPYADKYNQTILNGEELKQTMVDADIVELQGDYAQCRGGITTAQNLPNNDKLSVKTGGGRRNVYHRQVRMSGDKLKQQAILDRLVDKSLHQYFDKEADHLFVIGHENGHSLGPGSEYQNALGIYKHIIEEHKADTISLTFMPYYVKNGVIGSDTLKKIYVSYIVGRMFLAARPHHMLPHRMGELIQFNYLLEHNAISFNQEGLLQIDFDVLDSVLHKMLDETIAVQLSKSPEQAEKFINKYTLWGEYSAKIADVHKKLGLKPYKKIIRYF